MTNSILNLIQILATLTALIAILRVLFEIYTYAPKRDTRTIFDVPRDYRDIPQRNLRIK